MSKIVKKAGKALGVSKVFEGVKKVWKKVASNKFFKFAAIAAAVIFTGGAALGAAGGFASAFGAASAGGAGFLGSVGAGLSGAWTGAAAGLGSAWGGITGAGKALLGGIKGATSIGSALSSAGSSIAGGVTGATGAGAGSAGMTLGQSFASGVAKASGALAKTATTGLTGAAKIAGAPGITEAGAMGKTGLLIPKAAPKGLEGMISEGLKGISGYGGPGSVTAAVPGQVARQGVIGKMLSSPYTVPAAMSMYASQQGGEAEEDLYNERSANLGSRIYQNAPYGPQGLLKPKSKKIAAPMYQQYS